MANFKYSCRDKFSKLVSGITAAENKSDAVKKLQEMGYFPLSIEEVNGAVPGSALQHFSRVSLEEVNTFTRQLYALLKAGLPLLAGLEAIAEQTPSRYFKAVIAEMANRIKGGLSFSEALRRNQRVFGEVYICMIKAAEASGTMTEILVRLNELIEQQIDTQSRIKAATRYPILAFFTLVIGFLIIVTFVIPRFSALYGQFNALLPLPTRILIVISTVMRKFWYLFLVTLAAVVIIFRRFIRSQVGRPLWDNFRLKVPLFGKLVEMLTMARFSRILAVLMKSGVPILEIFDLVAGASGNIIISRAILNIKESVKQGRGMSEPMKVSGLFPPIVLQMVSAGEQSGKIDELLFSVADYYDRESGYLIKNLTTYIEPILIFILAIMVLVMALAIFMPMWNLIRVFRPG